MTATEFHEWAQKNDLRLETGPDGKRFYWLPGPAIGSKAAKEVRDFVIQNRADGLNYGVTKGGDGVTHLAITAPAAWF